MPSLTFTSDRLWLGHSSHGVHAGTEFKGELKKLFKLKNIELIEGVPGIHRSQGIVKRFNQMLAKRLIGHQYLREMLSPQERNVDEWVARLSQVVKAWRRNEINQRPRWPRNCSCSGHQAAMQKTITRFPRYICDWNWRWRDSAKHCCPLFVLF